jgi:hypothetical protein
MNRIPFLLVALFPAVARADGIISGPPVDFHFAAGTGLSWTSGSISVTNETIELCDTTLLTVPINDVLAIGDPIWLPDGYAVCGVALDLDDPTLLAGTGTSGGSVSMSLPMSTIQISLGTGLTIASTDTVTLELASPDWVTAATLSLGPGIDRTIDENSALYQSLKSALRNDSTIQP